MILNLITQQSTIIFACIKDSNSIQVKTCSLTRTVVRHLLTRNLLPLLQGAWLLRTRHKNVEIFISVFMSARDSTFSQNGPIHHVISVWFLEMVR